MTGNTTGLKASQHRALERTLSRRVDPKLLLSPELARHLAGITRAIGRQVGVLIDRSGGVVEVFVGDAHRVWLPDLGRARSGLGHRRGLRHVHTVLGDEGLQRDDLADLQKLRLDAVAVLAVGADGLPGAVYYAYALPSAGARGVVVSRSSGHSDPAQPDVHEERASSAYALSFDFAALMAALAAEEGRSAQARAPRAVGDARVRAVVMGVYPSRDTGVWRLAEIGELAQTAGVHVVDTLVQIRRVVDSQFVVGRGKLEEAVLRCVDVDADLLIFDHSLTPAQARAIAAMADLRVIDRTQLILDIFATHATSRDGKLQVELAQLKYTLPRLTDLDAGLSRLTGGIGGRGPGETKLEINRRRARDRIRRLERDIEGLSKQRDLRRARRRQSSAPTVAIVGYTNAGKSTLLNALTHADAWVADQLFATLDPKSRRLHLAPGREAILTDTVGFIRELPPDLMRAFRATLEELLDADLLLHVADVGDVARQAKVDTVKQVLTELALANIPTLLVYNKADAIDPLAARALAHQDGALAVSALQGMGLRALTARVNDILLSREAHMGPPPAASDAAMAQGLRHESA